MTNFLYEMQDELFNLNMILPIGEFSPIKKLVDHIEAQGKQLRELNKAITKKNETITGLRSTIASLNADKINLLEKVDELNNGIRDSEDLSWKEKYEASIKSWKEKYEASIKEKECAVNALQSKCKSLENQIAVKDIAIESVERANLDQGDTIGWYVEDFKKLKEENEKLKERCRYVEKDLEKEKQVNKDLNTIIISKNNLLDKYMLKCNNLEHNYDKEVKMKEQFKSTCFKHERTIESQNSTIKYLKGRVTDYVRLNAVLRGKLVSIGELANKIDDVISSEE